MPERFERKAKKFKPFQIKVSTEQEALALWILVTQGYDKNNKYCEEYLDHLDLESLSDDEVGNPTIKEQILSNYNITFGEIFSLFEEVVPSDIDEESIKKLADHIDYKIKDTKFPEVINLDFQELAFEFLEQLKGEI